MFALHASLIIGCVLTSTAAGTLYVHCCKHVMFGFLKLCEDLVSTALVLCFGTKYQMGNQEYNLPP